MDMVKLGYFTNFTNKFFISPYISIHFTTCLVFFEGPRESVLVNPLGGRQKRGLVKRLVNVNHWGIILGVLEMGWD